MIFGKISHLVMSKIPQSTKFVKRKVSSKIDFKWNSFYFTVWKFGNFSTTLISLEINFGWFQKVKNCRFNNFEGFEFWFLEKFHAWKCQNFPNNQKSERLKWSKWQFLRLQNSQNWIHIKSEWQKNYQKFNVQRCWKGQNGSFWGFKMAKIDFT